MTNEKKNVIPTLWSLGFSYINHERIHEPIEWRDDYTFTELKEHKNNSK